MRNVEAKFPLADIAAARRRAEAIGFEYKDTLIQHDTFFVVANGKLKLREQPDGGWLIHYHRQSQEGLEFSKYEIVAVAEPARMREMLSGALGVLAELRKRRVLLQRANVRLHLDEVADLGMFGELEAVLYAGQDPADARVELDTILAAMQITAQQLINVSYFELAKEPQL